MDKMIYGMTISTIQHECLLREESDQSGHLPRLIRFFDVHLMVNYGPTLSSCGQ